MLNLIKHKISHRGRIKKNISYSRKNLKSQFIINNKDNKLLNNDKHISPNNIRYTSSMNITKLRPMKNVRIQDMKKRIEHSYRYSPTIFSTSPSLILGGSKQISMPKLIAIDEHYQHQKEGKRGLIEQQDEIVSQPNSNTAYIVGGLYGNIFALNEIMRIKRLDEEKVGQIQMMFTGNFNGMNATTSIFREINKIALKNNAIRGYLEEEIGRSLIENRKADMKLVHHDNIDKTFIEHENFIVNTLRQYAVREFVLYQRITSLPKVAHLQIQNSKNDPIISLGICHGDPFNISGTLLNPENFFPIDENLRRQFSIKSSNFFSEKDFLQILRSSQMDGFLIGNGYPYYQKTENNNVSISVGKSGLPNFSGTDFGIITRVSTNLEQPKDSLYGMILKEQQIRFDTLKVQFDKNEFQKFLEENWTTNSPVTKYYLNYLNNPPNYSIQQAVRNGALKFFQ